MSLSLNDMNIAFVGAGSMAEAIIKGMVEKGGAQGEHISVINRSNSDRLQELSRKYGILPVSPDRRGQAISSADMIVLAMKPKDAAESISRMKSLLAPGQLLVSVVAGLSIDTIRTLAERDIAIVRAMPNTSSSIGLGATGITFSAQATGEQQRAAFSMFQSIGMVKQVEEPLLDMVTGVSGSGPAYIYYVMEAMIKGGIEGGLPPETARALTVQTVLGAAEMVGRTEADPAELRRKVMSPGGTTEAAIGILDRYRLSDAVREAVLRAAERGREMGHAISESMAKH